MSSPLGHAQQVTVDTVAGELPKKKVEPVSLVVPALALLVLVFVMALNLGDSSVGSLWLVTAVAAGIAILLLLAGPLPFLQNLVFYAIYFEAFVYLFAAPSLYASQEFAGDTVMLGLYRFIEISALVLFLPALIIGYRTFVPRPSPVTGVQYRPPLEIRPVQRSWLIVVSVLLPLAYVSALASAGLLFRRIGGESLAQALLQLPREQYLIIRVFDRLALPMICILLILLWQPQSQRYRILTLVALLVSGSTYLFVTVLNSRLQVLQITFAAVVVALFWGRKHITWSPGLGLRLAFVGLLALYLLSITLAVRVLLPTGQLSLDVLNPFRVTEGASSTNDAFRLNCVDLIAQITPPAQSYGFSMGASWQPRLFITFGQFLDPDLVNQYKQALATTPKYYLMLDYLGISRGDYPSCVVTDAYGNLGHVGLVVAGLVFGVLVAFAVRWLIVPSAAWQLVFGLVLLQMTSRFEGDFIGLALDWVAYAPAVVLLLIVNPFRIKRVPREKNVTQQ